MWKIDINKINEFKSDDNNIFKSEEYINSIKFFVLFIILYSLSILEKEVEEKIGLHRLARSNGVARNANVVIQIESRPQEQSYPDSYYWIIKNRNGMQGKGKMLKSYSCAKLIDCPIELDAENNIKDIDDISDEVEFIDFESTEQNSEE